MADDSELNIRVSADTGQISDLNRGILSHVAAVKDAQRQYEVVGSKLGDAAEGMNGLSLATAGATREIIVLSHEIVSGRFSRIPGSLMVLGERMGGLSLATVGWAAAIAGTGFALGELIAKTEQAEEFMGQFENRLEMAGKGYAFSASMADQLVKKLHDLPGVSLAAARSMAGDLAGSARLTSSDIEFLTNHVDQFARGSGQETPAAMRTLSSALEEPLTKYKTLDRQFDVLTPKQYELMLGFERVGDTASAKAVLIEALTARFNTMHTTVTPLEQEINNLKRSWDDLLDSFGKTGVLEHVVNLLARMAEGARLSMDYLRYIYSAKAGEDFITWERRNGPEATVSGEAAGAQNVASADAAKQRRIGTKDQLGRQGVDPSSDIAETRRVEEEKYAIQAEYTHLAADQKQITIQQEYDALVLQKEQEAEMEERSYQKQLALWATGSKEYQRILHEMELAKARSDLAIAKLEDERVKKMAEEQRKEENNWKQMFRTIEGGFRNAITGIITGSQTMQQAMANIARSVVSDFVDMALKSTESWLFSEIQKTNATVAGNAARSASNAAAAGEGLATQAASAKSSITTSAAEAAASVYADVAEIPYVGWILAPAAAAAAFGAVEAFGGSIPSAAGGWVVPNDTMAMVHENEMILPAHLSAGIGQMINGGADSGGSGDTHIHFNVSAIDAKGVQSFFDQHHATIGQQVAKAYRNGNRKLRTAVARR